VRLLVLLQFVCGFAQGGRTFVCRVIFAGFGGRVLFGGPVVTCIRSQTREGPSRRVQPRALGSRKSLRPVNTFSRVTTQAGNAMPNADIPITATARFITL